MKQNRTICFIAIFITYIVASLLGIFVFNKSYFDNFYLNVFVADVIATIFVYIVGLIFNNASVYDPYWSVAPLVIMPLTIIYFDKINIGSILLLIAAFYWGIRLTFNWAYTFDDLNHQDWRYIMLKEKTSKLYPIVSLLGIHLFPTIVVYFALLPALYYVKNSEFNVLSIIGFGLSILAATIQLISDSQMQYFRKNNQDKSKIIDIGLWRTSRHPNYFGEILMWWGVYLFCLASNLSSWFLILGPIINTLMFLLISIPMQERRLISYKDNYKIYIQTTNKLIPRLK